MMWVGDQALSASDISNGDDSGADGHPLRKEMWSPGK